MKLVAIANARVASSDPLSQYAARSSLASDISVSASQYANLEDPGKLSASLRINILSRKHVT